MIFHTAADTIYYNYFYNFYKTSIKYFYPFSDLSLHYMGKEEIVDPEIKYLSKENINTNKIKEKFNVTDKDAAGYYCLSRWLFLPNVTDNVIVSDVDIIAIKPIDQKKIDTLFKTYQIINVTRLKKEDRKAEWQ